MLLLGIESTLKVIPGHFLRLGTKVTFQTQVHLQV